MKKKFNYRGIENTLFNFSKVHSYKEILKVFKKKYNHIQSEIIYKKIEKNNLTKMTRLYFKVGSYFKSILNKVTLIRNIFTKFLPHLTDTKENKNLKLKSISQKEMRNTFNLFLKADKKKSKNYYKKTISINLLYLKK
ncbi:hypothetical protein ABXT43_00845 [Candidatus Pelagibacter sp. Uisw_114]